MTKALKIITALGSEPDLVLEIIDFFNGADHYKYNAEAEKIRTKFNQQKLTELHLICTKSVSQALKRLRQTVKEEYPELEDHIRVIHLKGNDISSVSEDDGMRQIVYNEVEKLADDGLIIASGGRKQVTQRLIEAGLLYGCLGYFTLTSPNFKAKRADSHSFNIFLTTSKQFSEERRSRIIRNEMGDNFRSLYLLPLQSIKRLQSEKIGIEPANFNADLNWLKKLPKSDLHCHLGGAYNEKLLKQMASLLLDDLQVDKNRRNKIIRGIEKRAKTTINNITANDIKGPGKLHPLKNIDYICQSDQEADHICKAVFIDGLSTWQIRDISRDGLSKEMWPKDLNWYMACGDLGGSTLLQTEGTLRLALNWLMDESYRENISLLEVRS